MYYPARYIHWLGSLSSFVVRDQRLWRIPISLHEIIQLVLLFSSCLFSAPVVAKESHFSCSKTFSVASVSYPELFSYGSISIDAQIMNPNFLEQGLSKDLRPGWEVHFKPVSML